MVTPEDRSSRRVSLSARVRLLEPHEAAATPTVSIDAVVGRTAADHLEVPPIVPQDPAKSSGPAETDFAAALRLRMEEARRRFDGEHLHLDHVETAALDYLKQSAGDR